MNRILIVLIVIFAVINVTIGGFYLYGRYHDSTQEEQVNYAYVLTRPVHTISGEVTSKSGSNLVLTHESGTLVTINTTPGTTYTWSVPLPSYLNAKAERLTPGIEHVPIGEVISVRSNSDLRNLEYPEITADNIVIPAPSVTFTGTLLSKTQSTITLQYESFSMATDQEAGPDMLSKQFKVTSETEIRDTRAVDNNESSQTYSLSDVPEGAEVYILISPLEAQTESPSAILVSYSDDVRQEDPLSQIDISESSP